MLKDNLELLGNKPNVFAFPQATVDSFAVDPADKELFISSINIFLRKSKEHFTHKYVKFHVDNELKYFDLVKIAKYPLPVVYNKSTKRAVINLKAMGGGNVSNIDMRDLYAVTAYAHVCSVFSTGLKINQKHHEHFCRYMSSVFVKLFSKRYGISGSYSGLLSVMEFLVSLYVLISFFDVKMNLAIKQASHIAKIRVDSIELDLTQYDFRSITSLLKALADSQATPGMDLYRFTDNMIRVFGQYGVMNLPFFEDLMRFNATLVTSSVNGNSYFPTNYTAFNYNLYTKLLLIIQHEIDRVS